MPNKKRRSVKSQVTLKGKARDARPARAHWMPDLGGAGRTKYLALVDAIQSAIAVGDLADGERLPTQRVLAHRLGVNIATVTKAIAEAGRRGLVVTRRGGGTHVMGTKYSLPTTDDENSAIIDLSINIPPVALVKPVLDEVIRSLARRRRADELFDYAPLGGTQRDRGAGSNWIAARGISAPTDRLIVTQGAYEGLFAALTAATQPGEVVLCEGINYTGIRRLGELCRIVLVGVPTDDLGLQPDALAEACARHSPKALVCTPVTLNPTTATQDLDRRHAVLAIAKRHAVTIIEDDIYGHLAGDPTPPLAALWPEGVIYVCGLSKCVAPGLRAGYLCAPEHFMSRVRDALLLLSWTAPSFHSAMATEMIVSGLAEACAIAHREEGLKRMKLAHGILCKSFAGGSAVAYHAWMRLPDSWHERDAASAFQRHGILVSPAHHFVIGEQATPSAVRLGLGAVADIGVLERALRTMASVLETRSTGLSSIV